MRFHVRCRVCRVRRVLAQTPGDYRNLASCPKCKKENTGDSHKCSGCGFAHLSLAPKCTSCKSTSYHVDKWMMERNTKAMKCACDGYHFEHRMGSLQCHYKADGSSKYGEPIELPGIAIDADF